MRERCWKPSERPLRLTQMPVSQCDILCVLPKEWLERSPLTLKVPGSRQLVWVFAKNSICSLTRNWVSDSHQNWRK